MENQYIQNNLKEVQEYLKYDIIVDIYNRNKNNPEKKELIEKIEAKFTDLYKYKSYIEASPHKAFLIPEGTEMNTVYMNTVNEVCRDLGLQVKLNPTEAIGKNDYVVITFDEFDKLDLKASSFFKNRRGPGANLTQNNWLLKDPAGASLVLDNLDSLTPSDVNVLKSAASGLIPAFCKKFSLVAVVEKGSTAEAKFNPALLSCFHVIEVPDAPLAKTPENAISAMREIREKANSVNDNQVKLNK